MSKFEITAEMMEKLEFDDIGTASKTMNTTKRDMNFKIEKFSTTKQSTKEACEKIKNHIKHLAALESEENCLPFYIAEKHINLGINSYDFNCKRPSLLTDSVSFCPTVLATHDISMMEVLYNIFLALDFGCNEIDLKYSISRQKFVYYLMTDVLNGKCNEAKAQWQPATNDSNQMHNPYGSMFVFDSGDLDASAYTLATSFDDPLIPWRIRSVYVQESCFQEFNAKLKSKLHTYPAEILRDQNYTDKVVESLKVVDKLKATIVQPIDAKSSIAPAVCYEFGREFFDLSNNLSPIVVLKVFRTAKEAIALAKADTDALGIIWTQNHSLAYELINNLDFSVFWINCIGVLNPTIPFSLRKGTNCIGSHFAFYEFLRHRSNSNPAKSEKECSFLVDALKSGCKNENSYHFEYFATKLLEKKNTEKSSKIQEKEFELNKLIDSNSVHWKYLEILSNHWNRKTVVFSYGITFAN